MSRIDRVLSFPGGSLLLAGRSGVGRRTITSLVSHMHGAVLFSPKISRGYALKQFKNDLKHVSASNPLLYLVLNHNDQKPSETIMSLIIQHSL